MLLSVYLPFLFSTLFGLAAPRLALRLPPSVGTWVLSIGGLLAAAGSVTSLALLGFTLVGQSPLLAQQGRWSDSALRHADPVALPVAVFALIVLAVLTVRVALAGTRRLLAIRAAFGLAASLPGGELAVVDHPDRQAFAIPGRPGRIVMSSGLLRSLDVAERRAVLAHERAHLKHRHHLHHTIAQLAAAGNPLLYRVPSAVALSTERWADEAATARCQRGTVADALIHTALGARSPTMPAVVLAVATTEVALRVRALRAPAPRLAVWRLVLLLALLVATAAAVLEAAHDTERLFELAQAAYHAGQH